MQEPRFSMGIVSHQVQYSTVPLHVTVQYSTVQYSTAQYSIQYSPHSNMPVSILHTAGADLHRGRLHAQQAAHAGAGVIQPGTDCS